MILSEKDFNTVQKSIVEVQRSGRSIRKIFANYYDDDVDINWEVDAAVDAFEMFSSRWTIETVSYTHLRAHETDSYLVCRLLLEKKKK